jgi:protein tyrosine phosphatase type IVA
MNIITHKGYKFIVTEAPTEKTSESFLKKFKSHNVTHFVRLSEESYCSSFFINNGIIIHDLYFTDGSNPSPQIIAKWISIVKLAFDNNETIAVHCVAGLGRSPLLVAIALIEYFKISNIDAVTIVRKKIKAALNTKQLDFALNYGVNNKCCIIL